MNLQLKKSDINLLIMFGGVLLALAAYFLVYQNLTARTETLKAENDVLGQEVEYLQELANNKQQYIDDTATMQKEIDDIKAQFPAEYHAEDDILYVVDLQEKYDMVSEAIQMDIPSVVEVVTQTQTPEAEAETGTETVEDVTVVDEGTSTVETAPEVTTPEIMLYRSPVTLQMNSGYNSLKDIIKTINTDDNRKSIDAVSIEFDTETGELKTTMNFSLYALSGTEAVYTTPTVNGVVYGNQNIFNTTEKKAAIDAEKKAQEEADAAKDEKDEKDKQ